MAEGSEGDNSDGVVFIVIFAIIGTLPLICGVVVLNRWCGNPFGSLRWCCQSPKRSATSAAPQSWWRDLITCRVCFRLCQTAPKRRKVASTTVTPEPGSKSQSEGTASNVNMPLLSF